MYFCDFLGKTFENTFENNYRSKYNCVPAISAVIQLNLRKQVFSAISVEKPHCDEVYFMI